MPKNIKIKRDNKGRFIKNHHASIKTEFKKGHKFSKYIILKMKQSHTGKKYSELHKESISKALKGRTYEDIYGIEEAKVQRKKRRIAQKNRKYPIASKRKMSLSAGGTGIPYEKAEYPQSFHKIRNKIRKRDNYICQKCNITEEEHIIVYGRVLCVHHIDYDKKNGNEHNLITLCNECNIRVNYNRQYWKNILCKKIRN